MNDFEPIERALLSCWDKTGLEDLAKALHKQGVQLYSTGGTADAIEKCGIPVTRVESVTAFPEMMSGRVKTLHPKIFGGLLARRDNTGDTKACTDHDIPLFELVVCNLYPFWEHLGEKPEEQTDFVDIGGPSMIRAAAKNFKSVMVLSEPAQYPSFLEGFVPTGGTDEKTRFEAAGKAFALTANYDSQIAEQWSATGWPQTIALGKAHGLRYGENPHQKASWCGDQAWELLQGKALSYNNLLDTEAALRITRDFETPAIAIIKHNNPCGVASGTGSLHTVFERALKCDPQSAFGGIVSCNVAIDAKCAQKMAELFLEVAIAKEFTAEAKQILSKKKNLRLIEWKNPTDAPFEARRALGGWLVQDTDQGPTDWSQIKTVTEKSVSESVWSDLQFCWQVAKHVRSNAIVLAKDGATIGIGAGQMSRVDAVKLALEKCTTSPEGAVLASDAFFPFRDNIDLLKDKGIAAVVQPGGSKRDSEVIDACNEHGIAMVFTGKRHFRH